jgi:DNA repair protein RadC
MRQPILDTPDATRDHLEPHCVGLNQEHFFVLTVDRKLRLINLHTVSIGTLSSTAIHPREVFRPAIRDAADGVIVAHNHPSGDANPSGADISVTRLLNEASKALQITLHDHIIIGNRCHAQPYYSFQASGLL